MSRHIEMQPNQRASLDATIAFSVFFGARWRRASEPGCWPLVRSMKAMAILQFITWLSVCLGAFAAEPTNTAVRVVISQFSRPPQDRIIVTSSNMIARIMTLFPGYEAQPASGFSSGGWLVNYTVDIAFADGHSRAIYIADNGWTAGAERYTPLAENWDELLGAMTTNFFKRTGSNMERLGQVHEATTLIIGPCDTVNGRGGDVNGQPDGAANVSSPFAADDLVPAPLNQILRRIKPGMTGAEVKAVLVTAYPKVQALLGDWDGMTGYVDFHLDERYSVSFSAHSPPDAAPNESNAIIGKNLLTYIFDRQRRQRLEIHHYQWETPAAEAQPKAKTGR